MTARGAFTAIAVYRTLFQSSPVSTWKTVTNPHRMSSKFALDPSSSSMGNWAPKNSIPKRSKMKTTRRRTIDAFATDAREERI